MGVSTTVKSVLKKFGFVLDPIVRGFGIKQSREVKYWKQSIANFQEWYTGRTNPFPPAWNCPCPKEEQKVRAPNLKDSAVLTWHKLIQERRYLADLLLEPGAFRGKKVMDVGSGPISGATAYLDAELYFLDPLFGQYLLAGYPLHYFGAVRYVNAPSEAIPLPDAFLDVIISLNAIDHVDDLDKTAAEIRRVLKPDGLFRMQVHYHGWTATEPNLINDERFLALFGWVKGLKKLPSPPEWANLLPPSETFVLWSNF
jgi:SAM-dependent methyltransferase